MANYLITGVSSGIGRDLTKRLVGQGHKVLGIARREKLLQDLKTELNATPKLEILSVDLAQENAWKVVLRRVIQRRFDPDVVIFNAAIFEKDYRNKSLDFSQMRRSFEINFFSIIKGFELLIKIVKPNTQFIFISSSSALKGSGAEGIGYPASKAALSSAFESLYQKYKKKYRLKIIYFGPISTNMLPSASRFTPILSPDQAVEKIVRVIQAYRVINYAPGILFLFLRFIKVLPDYLYLTILSLIDILHFKSSKK